jgi:hypothetical protein
MIDPITVLVVSVVVAGTGAGAAGAGRIHRSVQRDRQRKRAVGEQARLRHIRQEARLGTQEVSRSTLDEMAKVTARRPR